MVLVGCLNKPTGIVGTWVELDNRGNVASAMTFNRDTTFEVMTYGRMGGTSSGTYEFENDTLKLFGDVRGSYAVEFEDENFMVLKNSDGSIYAMLNRVIRVTEIEGEKFYFWHE
jgi:hypothetical protein